MRLIQTTEFHELFCDEVRGLYVFVRNRTKYPTPEVFETNVISAMRETSNTSFGMVVDSREAIGRNEKQFERVPINLNRIMFHSVAKVAILLKTQLGVMQSQRLIEQNKSKTLLSTTDEAEAFAFATTKGHQIGA